MNHNISDKKNNEVKYSKVQYFFWLLSGSEISILKECSTEYNRHASIGFTIFMTSLFGAFAGGYAGYFFARDPHIIGFDSGAILPAIIFGIIWGMLVFSIDRSMVISLKKNPLKEKQSFWAPFISRAILGGLIAFIISIPLEIKIFEESIIENEKEYKETKIAELKEKKTKNNDIPSIESDLLKKEQERELADSLLKIPEPNSLDFIEKKKEWKSSIAKESTLKKEWQDAENLRIQNLRLVPVKMNLRRNGDTIFDRSGKPQWILDERTEEYNSYLPFKNDAYSKRNLFDEQYKTSVRLTQEKEALVKKWITSNENNRNYADSLAKKLDKLKSEKKLIVQNDVEDLDNILKFQKGFILKYEILSFTAYKPENSSVLFFLWLIRILFFVIEILPTVVKLTTPLGQYDWAVYRKEKDFVEIYLPSKTKELEEDIETKKQIKKANEDYKNSKEQELHNKIVDEVARIQNQLAQKILNEYEEKEMNSISSTVNNFISNNRSS